MQNHYALPQVLDKSLLNPSVKKVDLELAAPQVTAVRGVSRIVLEMTGFDFAAPDEEPFGGNTNPHEVSLAIDRPHELVEDYAWRAPVQRLLSREPGTRRAVWRAILLDHPFERSAHER